MNLKLPFSIAVLCSASFFVAHSFAVPIPTTVTGNISPGETVVIAGTGFGARAVETPFYWDDYESKTVGQTALAAGLDDLGYDGRGLPKIQNDVVLGGTKSMRMDYLLNQDSMFPRIGKAGLNTTEVYVSVWTYFKCTAGTGAGYPILKLVRGGTNPTYSGVPRFYETVRPNSSGIIEGTDRGSVDSSGKTTWAQDIKKGQDAGGWHRSEYYFKLSTPGVADGMFQTWVDGVQNVNLLNTMSRLAASTALINYVMSPFDGNDSYGLNNSYSLWMDNFYIDTTRARVEIGDAATFAACKVRDIQPTVRWSDTSVSIRINVSAFLSAQKTYLYVIDANGNTNSSGFPLSAGEPIIMPGDARVTITVDGVTIP